MFTENSHKTTWWYTVNSYYSPPLLSLQAFILIWIKVVWPCSISRLEPGFPRSTMWFRYVSNFKTHYVLINLHAFLQKNHLDIFSGRPAQLDQCDTRRSLSPRTWNVIGRWPRKKPRKTHMSVFAPPSVLPSTTGVTALSRQKTWCSRVRIHYVFLNIFWYLDLFMIKHCATVSSNLDSLENSQRWDQMTLRR